MTIKEAKTGVIKKLKNLFPVSKYHYYSTQVTEGYKYPAIYVQIKPIIIESANYNTRSNRVTIYVTLYTNQNDDELALNFIDTMIDNFQLSIAIGDRSPKIESLGYDFVGTDRDIVEVSFDLCWMDRIDHAINAPLMERAEINRSIIE